MFDNLREEASKGFEEEAKFQPELGVPPAAPEKPSNLFGMTPAQRLVLSLMILAAVCVIGGMALFVMGKIVF